MYRLILRCVLLMPLSGFAQSSLTRTIIVFTDKKGSSFTLSDPGTYLSSASVQRRMRQHLALDSTDLPIVPAYLDSIASVPNVILLNRSKWLNQVLIKTTDPAALTAIRRFSFVRQIAPIAAGAEVQTKTGHAKKFPEIGNGVQGTADPGAKTQGAEKQKTETQRVSGKAVKQQTTRAAMNRMAGTDRVGQTGSGDLLSYGNSFDQIHIHKGEYLHNLDFTGQGMTIAVIDGGFSGYLSNPVFDSALTNGQILGSWDFVNNKQSVNEEDIHGMYCLSTMAANRPGIIVGSAPGAKFWLFKTEDLGSEYPVEEQNWAAAAEFADSVGADLITTSLGYVNFDDPSLDHTYAQRDGHSAISTRAANFAVGKGMIVLASAGNAGADTADTKYVGCPGDGDSVLTVGATDYEGRIAAFSSWGPNAAGRIKPDVVSVGVGTVVAAANGGTTRGSGTSFSTPNLAGLVACLWQAFPEFSNHAILDAVRESASNPSRPDGRFGYGLPDFFKAYEILQQARGVNAIIRRGTPWITAAPVPFSDELTVVFKGQDNGNAVLALIDGMGRTIERQTVATLAGQWTTVRFASGGGLSAGVYFVHYSDGKRQTTLPVVRK